MCLFIPVLFSSPLVFSCITLSPPLRLSLLCSLSLSLFLSLFSPPSHVSVSPAPLFGFCSLPFAVFLLLPAFCALSTDTYRQGGTYNGFETLQKAATHCNTLQQAAADLDRLGSTSDESNTLQHSATHCSTLQQTATHYNTLQHTVTHCHRFR